MERPEVAAGGGGAAAPALHFVDDRFETLEAVVRQAPDLLGRYVRREACVVRQGRGRCRAAFWGCSRGARLESVHGPRPA